MGYRRQGVCLLHLAPTHIHSDPDLNFIFEFDDEHEYNPGHSKFKLQGIIRQIPPSTNDLKTVDERVEGVVDEAMEGMVGQHPRRPSRWWASTAKTFVASSVSDWVSQSETEGVSTAPTR